MLDTTFKPDFFVMIIELYLYSHIIVVHLDNGTKVYRILDEAALLIYSATMLLFCHGLVAKKPVAWPQFCFSSHVGK